MDYQIITRLNKKGDERHTVRMEVWHEGKRKYVTAGTYGTMRQAIEAGGMLRIDHESNAQKRQTIAGNLTLDQWTTEWLNGLDVKDSTKMVYRYRLNKYILPTLGSYKLNEIDQIIIKRWLNSLPTKGIRKIAYPPLRISLNAAVGLGMLADNPTKGLRIEGSKAKQAAEAEESQVKVWDYLEAKRLLDAAVGHRAEGLIVLGLYGGLRPGEVVGLTWDKFDWLNGTVLVNKTMSTFNGVQYESTTKTGISRTVKLPFDAIQRLVRMQEASTSDRVYAVTHFQVVGQNVKAICKKAGVPYLNPHCLRHTCASMLLAQAVPLAAVAKLLGHTTPATTLAVYSHCLPTDEDNATIVLAKVLGTDPGPMPVETASEEVL